MLTAFLAAFIATLVVLIVVLCILQAAVFCLLLGQAVAVFAIPSCRQARDRHSRR